MLGPFIRQIIFGQPQVSKNSRDRRIQQSQVKADAVLSTAREANVESGGLDYQILSSRGPIEKGQSKRIFEFFQWEIIIDSEAGVNEGFGGTGINKCVNVFDVFSIKFEEQQLRRAEGHSIETDFLEEGQIPQVGHTEQSRYVSGKTHLLGGVVRLSSGRGILGFLDDF